MSHNPARRRWLLTAAAGIAGFGLAKIPAVSAATSRSAAAVPPHAAPRLATAQVATDLLDIGYYTAGPEEGRPVVLLHDFGYDIDSYAEVASLLAAQGLHVIVPYLRGHGSTRFLDSAAIRSGQPAALGYDAIGVFDALHIPEVVIAGFGWGARAAMAAAALKPTRIRGLMVVDDYLEYGEVPSGRSSAALENPDYLAVTTHAYRYHQGQAPGDPQYDNAEKNWPCKRRSPPHRSRCSAATAAPPTTAPTMHASAARTAACTSPERGATCRRRRPKPLPTRSPKWSVRPHGAPEHPSNQTHKHNRNQYHEPTS